VKYAWIEEHRDQYSVTRMCRQLEVSRTGYCQWKGRAPSTRSMANAVLDARVAAIHASSKRSYGRPRIVRELRDQGVQVSHERVRNSLKRQNLRPVYERPYRVTTDSAHHKPVASNVLDRRFDGWEINQAWVGDITYIATGEGWLYLACVMDLSSRRIVGWSMSNRIKADLVCQALKSAYWRRKPPQGLIMHSDRGSQYASDQHRQLIQDYRMIQSMSRRANCWDNAAMESFFKTLKVERVHRLRYDTRAAATLDIVDWIEGFYNQRRIHSSIGFKTPVDVESDLMTA
tara:strand:+ start:484 stop:1347 length:864 start_codon:yes stop_codon:yes gene_type:complete